MPLKTGWLRNERPEAGQGRDEKRMKKLVETKPIPKNLSYKNLS